MRSLKNIFSERRLELAGVVVGAFTALLFLALVSDKYHVRDQATRPFDEMLSVENLLGPAGALVAGTFAILVGDARHVTYSLTFIWALMLFSRRPVDRLIPRLLGAGLLITAVAGFLQLNLSVGTSNPDPGGAIGAFVVQTLNNHRFGIVGSNIIICAMIVVGLLLATEQIFIYLFIVARHGGRHLFRGSRVLFEAAAEFQRRRAEKAKTAPAARRPARASLPLDPREDRTAPESLPDPAAALEDPDSRLARINIRGASDSEYDAEEELPFDAVPEIEYTEFEASGPVASLAIDLDPLEADLPDEELATDEGETAWNGDGYPVEAADGAPVELAIPEETAPAPAPKVRRPRRKIVEHEELPPGYEYPRFYTRPPMDILDEPEERVLTNLAEQLRSTSVLLEGTLQTFGIEARVTDVTRGPTITRYELEPAPGIKVARFLALADDIALALKAHRIRVEAPIPGKGRVGIEAPNADRDQVLVRELLESPQFKRGKGKLNLVLGKDITGDVKIADLTAMPHLLVAGATGAGKTVCVKALLASLLFKHSPDDLQLILIDPKMVELSIFNDIPHLITPVVIDPKKASVALTWLINEMEDRYRLFADLRVRNIEVYNHSVENGEIELEGEDEDGEHHSVHVIRRLPYIVCVIDELADLMMLARSEVEDSIGRLAQLARAVGIHLIIATQRPSVDVLTGVIKANFPSRISFQVSSRVDSRCILDEIGAERLIGMGDMLYLPAGQSKPTRIQGAFVSDEEMNALIMHLKRQAPPQYKDEIENFGKAKDKLEEIADEADDLFEEAVQVVMETGQASISMVQRRLRVGYTRAARLIDMMERKGIVGPHTGSKAREILVDAVHVEDSL